MRVLRSVQIPLATLPLVTYGALWLLVLEGSLATGAFPVRGLPDPKFLILYPVVGLGIFLTGVGTPLYLASHWLEDRRRAAGAARFVAGWAVIGIQLTTDPFGLVNWFLD